MERRMSWTTGSALLRGLGCEVGRGWTNTILKLAPYEQEIDIGGLQDALVEHLLCGEKLTKLYKIDPQFRDRLLAALTEQAVNDGPATSAYPFGLSEDELADQGSGFNLLSVVSNADGVGLLFSTVFAFQKREEISFEEFEAPEEMMGRFTNIVGTRYVRSELFHVIWLPHDRDILEVRVDFPSGLGMTEANAFHSQLKKMINKWGIVSLGKPVDLFPAVKKFYKDKTDGDMFDITFATSTGAIKHEQALAKTGKRDQREEAYHLAGLKAVDDISIYKISVEWPRSEGKNMFVPTITLAASGPSGQNGGQDPVINAVHVQKCARIGDYEWAIGRLEAQCGLN